MISLVGQHVSPCLPPTHPPVRPANCTQHSVDGVGFISFISSRRDRVTIGRSIGNLPCYVGNYSAAFLGQLVAPRRRIDIRYFALRLGQDRWAQSRFNEWWVVTPSDWTRSEQPIARSPDWGGVERGGNRRALCSVSTTRTRCTYNVFEHSGAGWFNSRDGLDVTVSRRTNVSVSSRENRSRSRFRSRDETSHFGVFCRKTIGNILKPSYSIPSIHPERETLLIANIE